MSSLLRPKIRCPDHNFHSISDFPPLLFALFPSDFQFSPLISALFTIPTCCLSGILDGVWGWGSPPSAECGALPLPVPTGLGSRGDIISVKKSVGRNRLLPQGLAVYASPENRRLFEEEKQNQEGQMEAIQTQSGERVSVWGCPILIPPPRSGPTLISALHTSTPAPHTDPLAPCQPPAPCWPLASYRPPRRIDPLPFTTPCPTDPAVPAELPPGGGHEEQRELGAEH
uniref:Large ribosomal subunit protein bL9m n=1 Tax=Meleagris gallopavo TaxID=9103 RepID=A0A803YP64_MELGA